MKQDDPLTEFEQQLHSLAPRPLSDEAAETIHRRLTGEAEAAPPPRRLRAWWALTPIATAACLVLAFTLIGPGNKNSSNNAANNPGNTAPGTAIALANWRVQPTGDADYTIAAADHIRLDRGELYVESIYSGSVPADAQGLTITTPDGVARATGTRFYIGSHSGPAAHASTKGPAMKRLTRILILSGVVTLTTPLGSITGSANELLAAEEDKAPAKMVAQANTSFALDLYKQLGKENQGKNLFFSPYSISSALAMATEGARGQTAEEMGGVLGYPKQARRIGNDAQLMPWETALINAGYKQINDRLNGQDTEEARQKRATINTLREQLAELNKIVGHFQSGRKLDGKQVNFKQADAAMKSAQTLADKINKLEREISAYEIKVANALWANKSFEIRKPYADAIGKYFGSGGVQRVDFRRDFAGSAKQINRWIEGQTNNRIKDLVSEDGNPLTRLMITNAIFFKGEWAEPFDAEQTRQMPFILRDGKRVKTTIMFRLLHQAKYAAFNADGTFFNTPDKVPADSTSQKPRRYPDPDGFKMVELPYKGDEISMLLVAPNRADRLAELEKLMKPQRLSEWQVRLKSRSVETYLPKFKMEATYKLNGTLKAMGIKQAFKRADLNGGADFTGISASGGPLDQIYIDSVMHKTFIEVNEKGTEAAAATTIAFAGGGITEMIPFTPEFRADRPFIYLIRDNQTGAILFIGRMMDPTAE